MTSETATRIPEIDDVAMAFGGADEHLPAWDDLPDEFKRMKGPFCNAASQLFYSGGKIDDHGLSWKPEMTREDRVKAVRLSQALLGSFGPKHEHKIGGVGFLFSQWLEPDAKPES